MCKMFYENAERPAPRLVERSGLRSSVAYARCVVEQGSSSGLFESSMMLKRTLIGLKEYLSSTSGVLSNTMIFRKLDLHFITFLFSHNVVHLSQPGPYGSLSLLILRSRTSQNSTGTMGCDCVAPYQEKQLSTLLRCLLATSVRSPPTSSPHSSA